jgi:hypothetical protein
MQNFAPKRNPYFQCIGDRILGVAKMKQVVLCIPNAGVFNPLLKY